MTRPVAVFRRSPIGRAAAGLAVAALLLTGCGDDSPPSKAEFTSQVKQSLGKDISRTLSESGIDAKAATKIVDDYIGCVYNRIKGDPALLKIALGSTAEPADQAPLDERTKQCTDTMNTAMTKVLTSNATGGS